MVECSLKKLSIFFARLAPIYIPDVLKNDCRSRSTSYFNNLKIKSSYDYKRATGRYRVYLLSFLIRRMTEAFLNHLCDYAVINYTAYITIIFLLLYSISLYLANIRLFINFLY